MATRMTPVEKQKLLFFTDRTSELIVFKFKGQDKEVKIHKSVLVDSSPFFKDMFQNVTNTDPLEPILIDDDTDFDRVDGFIAFVEALYETNPMVAVTNKNINDWWKTMDRILQVHCFADKYQVDWLINKCKELARSSNSHFATLEMCPQSLEMSLKLVKALSLDEQIQSVAGMRLQPNKEYVVPFFDLAKKWQLDEVMNKLAKNCCDLEWDQSWPVELNGKIITELQKRTKK